MCSLSTQDSHLSGSEVVWQADLTDETTAPEEESEGVRRECKHILYLYTTKEAHEITQTQ